MILYQADITMIMLEGLMKPGSFDEAYSHSDLHSRYKWRSDMDKGFKLMNVKGSLKGN
jgi:hypothetical protein